MEELLTIEDVCRLFKFKKSYIYHLTHCGKVPHIKIGNHVRFRESELLMWLNSQTQTLDSHENPDQNDIGRNIARKRLDYGNYLLPRRP